MNLNSIFYGKVTCRCPLCKRDETECSFKKEIDRHPQYLWLQLMRFSFDQKLGKAIKIDTEVNVPYLIPENVFGCQYDLVGIVYHIGDSPHSGHYISKYISYDDQSIETYDDSRCYRNPAEKQMPMNNAYILMFQTHKSRMENRPAPSKREIDLSEALKIMAAEKEDAENELYQLSYQKMKEETVKSKKSMRRTNEQAKLKSKGHAIKGQPSEEKALEIKTLQTAAVNVSRFAAVDTEKVMNLFRKYSYLCSLEVLDKSHGIDSMCDLYNLIRMFFQGLFMFHGFNPKTLFNFIQEWNALCIVPEMPFSYLLQLMFNVIDSFKNFPEYNTNKIVMFLKMCIDHEFVQLDTIQELYKKTSTRTVKNTGYFEHIIYRLEDYFQTLESENC